jgi:hypothetical protein
MGRSLLSSWRRLRSCSRFKRMPITMAFFETSSEVFRVQSRDCACQPRVQDSCPGSPAPVFTVPQSSPHPANKLGGHHR